MRTETIQIANGAPVPAVYLDGIGFRLVPQSGPTEFPRTVELDGRRESITGAAWFSTRARQLRVLPAADGNPVPVDSAEQWQVVIATCCQDLTAGAPAPQGFVQKIAAAASIPTAAPSTAIDGYPVQISWRSVRAFFRGLATTDTITKYVYSSQGVAAWKPAGQLTVSAGTEEVEDELVIVGAERIAYVCSTAGRTLDLVAQHAF